MPYRDVPVATGQFARKLRADKTIAEQRIWQLLRNRRLDGFKFRQQHPVPPYVLDFYCHELKLGIELDGSQHVLQIEKDAHRSNFLADKGIRVIRFWNNDVLANTTAVLEAIWQAVQECRLNPR